MQFTFCPQCGGRLTQKKIGDEGEVPFCGECGRPWFGFSYPCVICLLTDGAGKYALIRQTYATRNYVCVAGFIHEGETAEQTAVREVREETGLEVLSMRYISSYYYPKHDNLMIGYLCTVKPGEFRLSGEVERAGWFGPEETRELLSHGTVGRELFRDSLK
ncbi:MAG: NUDIX domain-containing protein [Oscillospiraceae bacterium]|nr:NUDIX domain-containing protein [Oscillospiraceae bacterium]